MEFVLIFVTFSWPINFLLRPEFKLNSALGYFTGGTNYATKYKTPICGLGIIMALSRLRDPLIRLKCYHIWMSMTCRRNKINDNDFNITIKKTSLNAFLRSSLNTELVISILKGITILAASTPDSIDHIADSDMLQVK